MACSSEKATVGVGIAGVVGNVVFGVKKFTIASPILFIAAVLRLLAGIENLEMCGELNGVDVDKLRQQRDQLQREVDDLQRQMQQQPAH